MSRDFSHRFREEHAAFARGLKGVPNAERCDRAAVVLHRLMFLYFLQANGWLDGDLRYLARFLGGRQASFYRSFLRPFLHNGLSKPPGSRRRDWGRVPYLGARLSSERDDFDVADSAFRRLFAFFDEYQWSFGPAPGDRPAVRPEWLGTLFEKHVNRKETGTYYTPTDVTEYVAHNTILPILIDAAFAPGSLAWQLLRSAPDRYIRDAVRHGVDEPLPARTSPDRPAPARFGLPTESWREHLSRRQRCRWLRELLAAGTVTSANDLVTHNLDLLCFVRDGIAVDRGSHQSLRAALETITVLDPTCGSGAFLFATLDVLDALWNALEEPRPSRIAAGLESVPRSEPTLNLYGVDLREEAIELCRLRFVLRLLAMAKPGEEADFSAVGTNLHTGDVLGGFPGAMPAGGFDVVIGNPPYLAARREAAVKDFVTAGCPDVYAWVLERSAGLLRDGGRTGMVVPLSLAFSADFAPCRRLLFATYGTNWFSAFARIPSALFAGDIRVRNTIHLGHKTREPGGHYCTRLHRWFEVARPQLFPSLEYTPFRPECWDGRIPRLNSPVLLEVLGRKPGRLGDGLSRRPTPYPLYFKKTAYNWLTFCKELPPCYAADGSAIPHTQFDVLHFPDETRRDLAFLLLNGKWAYAFWCAAGDDFHVARWLIADLPVDLSALSGAVVGRLLPLVGQLERAMSQAVSFKQNAGKRVGSYNLARCRRVTDRSDRLFAEALGWSDAWPDLELLVRQVVKTDFEV